MKPEVLSTAKTQRMAEFFSALADPHRLKLLSALAQQELCVCDLAAGVFDSGKKADTEQFITCFGGQSGLEPLTIRPSNSPYNVQRSIA